MIMIKKESVFIFVVIYIILLYYVLILIDTVLFTQFIIRASIPRATNISLLHVLLLYTGRERDFLLQNLSMNLRGAIAIIKMKALKFKTTHESYIQSIQSRLLKGDILWRISYFRKVFQNSCSLRTYLDSWPRRIRYGITFSVGPYGRYLQTLKSS